ncbi:hypothetical protein DFH27DRAFT_225647 [Peziza echinospora]|nr:hypothetical protein DFH27DRAFT_225647 [Peziza echinospora]
MPATANWADLFLFSYILSFQICPSFGAYQWRVEFFFFALLEGVYIDSFFSVRYLGWHFRSFLTSVSFFCSLSFCFPSLFFFFLLQSTRRRQYLIRLLVPAVAELTSIVCQFVFLFQSSFPLSKLPLNME